MKKFKVGMASVSMMLKRNFMIINSKVVLGEQTYGNSDIMSFVIKLRKIS
jgi:hypothetical protein